MLFNSRTTKNVENRICVFLNKGKEMKISIP